MQNDSFIGRTCIIAAGIYGKKTLELSWQIIESVEKADILFK